MARRALLVGVSSYEDEGFADLEAPLKDVAELSDILKHEAADYLVQNLLNPSRAEFERSLQEFFEGLQYEDIALVYFSGHGDIDIRGRLYFACTDTHRERLLSSGSHANLLTELIDTTMARQVIIILDCCHSGAFRLDASKGGTDLADSLTAELNGEGRAILTAAGPWQEAIDAANGSHLSAFTRSIINGLRSGEADLDGDGFITITELFEYARHRLQLDNPTQTPRFLCSTDGKLVVSKDPRTVFQVPTSILELVNSNDKGIRRRGVSALGYALADASTTVERDKIIAHLREIAASDDIAISELASVFIEAFQDHLENTVVQSQRAHRAMHRVEQVGSGRGPGRELYQPDPEWFKRAIFYQLLVDSFADSNGDGVGDLRGLLERLDYLQWLGIDALVLDGLFSASTESTTQLSAKSEQLATISTSQGTTADLLQLLDAAHERGIRIVLAISLGVTSDRHSWFQASRRNPSTLFGDFYIWHPHPGDSDQSDFDMDSAELSRSGKVSRWVFDSVRQEYFWSLGTNVPALNFLAETVQEVILDSLRFWLDLGIDGFRLDAVPYLFERDGTNGENLPETHEFLKRVRKEVDANYPDRVLLCEANQWPDDVVQYFGDYSVGGDECHMAFHFPVIPRIFMAVRRESRYPISEILAQTPPIPDRCQWGIFLRNHDELTLEMVTDEERDYMWAEYAQDPRMKANIGIRRRLAPLLDNDLNRIELFTALLLSLPGSPVLYYGDEIGMGDNIWLEGCEGLRTAMQWTPDRNAGFSHSDPGRVKRSPINDSIYGYQVTNVESQTRNTSSLLHWTRRMIGLRKANPAFGMGTFTDLGGSNPCVWTFVRAFGDDVVVCVNNLSRFPQAVELDLRGWQGAEPIEMTGGSHFPAIGELPYLLILTGHAYLWLRIPVHSLSAWLPEPTTVDG